MILPPSPRSSKCAPTALQSEKGPAQIRVEDQVPVLEGELAGRSRAIDSRRRYRDREIAVLASRSDRALDLLRLGHIGRCA